MPHNKEKVNYSTNKMVRPSAKATVGTAVKTAKGSKRVKPGGGNTTSAKTVKSYETAGMKYRNTLKSKGTIDTDSLRKIKRFNKGPKNI